MTARAPLGLAATLALALCGCAVGPKYAVPPTPTTAGGPFVSADRARAADQPLPPYWWRLYRDPVLDRLVLKALAENNTLKAAAANLAYAQGLLDEARAGRYPTTDLTAGPNYGRSAQQAAAGAPAALSFAAGFTAAYQVDLFGRIRRAIEAAGANLEATQATEDATRVTVAGATAGAYANICGLGEQIDVAKTSLSVVQQTYDITAAQRDAGALSDFEVARQGVLLDQAKAAIAPLEGQRRFALFTLAALIGKTPAEVPADAAAC
ncbi:MAG: TolC family protein, partial [Pseudomonadota bacterium]|nr:TolC family protein [Pseudomonadota bacterium]